MEAPEKTDQMGSHLLNLIYVQPPLLKILSYLNRMELIKLAATNKKMKNFILQYNNLIREFNNSGRFNFINVPFTISNVNAVHRVLPNLTNIRMILERNYYFSMLKKFQALNKLTISVPHHRTFKKLPYQRSENALLQPILSTQSLKIIGTPENINTGPLYILLEQISDINELTIHNYEIGWWEIRAIKTKPLTKLKLCNVKIKFIQNLSKYLLTSKTLTKLLLIANNADDIYLMPLMKIILRGTHKCSPIWTDLAFPIELEEELPYENIIHFDKLKNLQIYYSTEAKQVNIEKLIKIAKLLNNVQVTFIEYFDIKHSFFEEQFGNCEEISDKIGKRLEALNRSNKNIDVKRLSYPLLKPYYVFSRE